MPSLARTGIHRRLRTSRAAAVSPVLAGIHLCHWPTVQQRSSRPVPAGPPPVDTTRRRFEK